MLVMNNYEIIFYVTTQFLACKFFSSLMKAGSGTD